MRSGCRVDRARFSLAATSDSTRSSSAPRLKIASWCSMSMGIAVPVRADPVFAVRPFVRIAAPVPSGFHDRRAPTLGRTQTPDFSARRALAPSRRSSRAYAVPVRRELYAGVMSGTSLDGVDAVIAEFMRDPGECHRHAGRDPRHISLGAARRIDGTAEPRAPTKSRARRAAPTCWPISMRWRSPTPARRPAWRRTTWWRPASMARPCGTGRSRAGRCRSTIPRASRSARTSRSSRISAAATSRRAARARRWCRPSTRRCSGHRASHRVVVNIGGIANVTDLPPRGAVSGFDTGPGNVLMDLWSARHRGDALRRERRMGGAGAMWTRRCWRRLLAEPYFALRRRPRAPDATCSTPAGSMRC